MSKNSAAAALFNTGQAVTFQTAGKSGVSVERKGIVVSLAHGERGVWVVISEEGAADGVTVRTRASLVRAA